MLRRIITTQPSIPSRLSADCRDLLTLLLAKNPDDRLGVGGVEEVKGHSWFKVHVLLECCSKVAIRAYTSAILLLLLLLLLSTQGVDWDAVLSRKLAPPFKPYISDELDVGNFSTQFTELVPVDSPAQPPPKHLDIFRVGGHLLGRREAQLASFLLCQGYSFIAPSVLFTDNLFTALNSQLHSGVATCQALRVSPILFPLSSFHSLSLPPSLSLSLSLALSVSLYLCMSISQAHR